MRIEVTENVEATFEVDIDLDQVLDEFFMRLEDEDQGGSRRTVSVMLDSVTKLLAKLTDKSIASLPWPAREEVRKRLEAQIVRY